MSAVCLHSKTFYKYFFFFSSLLTIEDTKVEISESYDHSYRLVVKKISFILSNLLLYFRDKNRYFTTIILSIVICSTAIAVDKKSQIISKINGVIRPILQCPIYVTQQMQNCRRHKKYIEKDSSIVVNNCKSGEHQQTEKQMGFLLQLSYYLLLLKLVFSEIRVRT